MRTAVICIARLEGNYIREFIDHYRSLGFSNVIVCDNDHDDDGEDLPSIIQDYIDDGFVIVENWHNQVRAQMRCYTSMYQKYGYDYDAILFCDIDEHLTLIKHKNISEFLESFPDDWEAILCNWAQYGDNGQIYADYTKTLEERFTEPRPNAMSQYNFVDDFHVKSIIRGRLPFVLFRGNPHVPDNQLVCYNSAGQRCDSRPFQPVDHSTAYFKHFCTKSLEEYCTNKLRRGSADRDYQTFLMTYANRYFKINDETPEKLEYLSKIGFKGI